MHNSGGDYFFCHSMLASISELVPNEIVIPAEAYSNKAHQAEQSLTLTL